MNKEMFLRVADAIEAESVRGERVGLHMCTWHGNSCGTTACIGGFVDLLVDRVDLPASDRYWIERSMLLSAAPRSVFEVAKEALDLPRHEASHLMTDSDLWTMIHERKQDVPDALRWMAATGIVDWPDALHASRCARINKENIP